MAKVSGLGGAVTVADSSGYTQAITDDITNWTLSTPRAVQDVTGVGKYANERLLLLADISLTLNAVFNSSAGTLSSHEVFSSVTSTSVARSTVLQPTAGTVPALTANILYTDYGITRAATGELTTQMPGVLADGSVPAWQNS